MRTLSTIALLHASAFGWSAAAAVQASPATDVKPSQATPPAATQPVSPTTEKPAESSIDDLLGIGKANDNPGANAADAAAQEHDKQLKNELNDAQVADAFTQAIDKMSVSARLLDTQFDPGVGTQRVQEDIIAKLNILLDQAKKNKQKSKSSSSNPTQSQGQQTPNPTPQKQKPAQKSGDKRNEKPKDSQEGDPPPPEQGDINTVLEESRSEWGALPQRVRDMLMQGRRDKFSSLYQQMTQEYYKRLAEEGTP